VAVVMCTGMGKGVLLGRSCRSLGSPWKGLLRGWGE